MDDFLEELFARRTDVQFALTAIGKAEDPPPNSSDPNRPSFRYGGGQLSYTPGFVAGGIPVGDAVFRSGYTWIWRLPPGETHPAHYERDESLGYLVLRRDGHLFTAADESAQAEHTPIRIETLTAPLSKIRLGVITHRHAKFPFFLMTLALRLPDLP